MKKKMDYMTKNIKEEVDVLEKSSVTKGNTKDKKEKKKHIPSSHTIWDRDK